MRKIIFCLSIMAMTFAFITTGISGEVTTAPAQQFQTADSSKFNTLDTIVNTASATYTKNIKGAKSVVVLSVDINAVTATPGGTIKYYRAIGGGWKLMQTDTISGAATYDYAFTPGTGLSYKIIITGGASQTFSYTARCMYR